MSKPKSNYKAAATMTRGCKTKRALADREESNERLYRNGCLTSSEYRRLTVIEMDKFSQLSSR